MFTRVPCYIKPPKWEPKFGNHPCFGGVRGSGGAEGPPATVVVVLVLVIISLRLEGFVRSIEAARFFRALGFFLVRAV